jgi:lipopolysaccharide/colanic/teichoic acid biosynthesis glycosyltransferase
MKIENIRYGVFAADCLAGISALGLAIGLRYGMASDGIGFSRHFQDYGLMALVALLAWAVLYFKMGLDGFQGGWQLSAILSKLIVADALLIVVVPAAAFVTQHYYSRLVLLYFVVLLTLGQVVVRLLARSLVSLRVHPLEDRCVILGNGPVARELADKIASHPELPFQVIGFLFRDEPDVSNGFTSPRGMPCTSVKTLQLLDLLREQRICKLIIAMNGLGRTEIPKLIAECEKAFIQVYLVPHFYDLYVSRAELAEIDGLPLLSLRKREPFWATAMVKRTTDFVLSLGLLLAVSPVLLVAALMVRWKKGKAFRAEPRCGKDGIPFAMRRLNVDRHAPDPPGYERFLIRWSLTELPQLWNVLRGDMSLVGPRPESAERLKYYSDWQRQRLKVRGGVTGLAQVHGLREHHSSEDKARFDLQYILNWSLFLDLSLLLQTVWTLLVRGLRPEPASRQPASYRGEERPYLRSEVANANRT